MTRNARTALLLLSTSTALVALAGAVLVFTVPSFKAAVKEKWHRWSCPEVPETRSERIPLPDGTVDYRDPHGYSRAGNTIGPDLHFAFEDRLSTLFTEVDGRGVRSLKGISPAIVRQVADVADSLVAIGVGLLLMTDAQEPDVRIIIRIDAADGSLLEWQQKRLRTNEHIPGEWERFNFEWILRELHVPQDARVAVFIRSNGPISVDVLDLVFRGPGPLIRAAMRVPFNVAPGSIDLHPSLEMVQPWLPPHNQYRC